MLKFLWFSYMINGEYIRKIYMSGKAMDLNK